MKKFACALFVLYFALSLTAAASGVQPFADVPGDSQYSEAVAFVCERGIFVGTDAGLFEPDAPLTRAMLVTIIWRLEGRPAMGAGKSGTFSDVPEYAWYTEAAEWCAAREIVYGYGDPYMRFGPSDLATREQVYTVLLRYAAYKGYDAGQTGEISFSDAADISEYALPALKWALAKGFIPETLLQSDATLRPAAGMTRAQTAYVLRLFCTAYIF